MALKSPPQRFKALLSEVNLIPADEKFPVGKFNYSNARDIKKGFRFAMKALKQFPDLNTLEESKAITNNYETTLSLSRLPSPINGLRPASVAIYLRHFMMKCEELSRARDLLQSIAHLGGARRGTGQLSDQDIMNLYTGQMITSFVFRDGPGGVIDFDLGSWLDDLRGAEIDRIRECEICKRLFWAGRKTAICCRNFGDKCINAFSQRQHRRKNEK